MYGKTTNFFKSIHDLKILTKGSSYFTVMGHDIALTKNQNLFIKVPEASYKTGTAKELIDNIIGYLVVEGFLPKTKLNKKVSVWVYN